MTNLHAHVTRIARKSLDAFKSAMGIESPSRAFANLRWPRLDVDGKRWPPMPPEAPAPWYSARSPRDAYESPELRSAARRVRRLIRRHWYELMFDMNSPIGASVQAAMMHPPKPTHRGSVSLLEAVQQLEALGMVPKFDGAHMRDFAARCGVKWEGET